MRDKKQSRRQIRLWRHFVTLLLLAVFCGGLWAIHKYIPPQHLFWKPLDTNLPLGFATKQQLFTLNLKSSETCIKLAKNTEHFKTSSADPQRPSSGAGKNVCGWDVARVVYGTDTVLFAPKESQMQCPLSLAVYLWQREVNTIAQKHFGQPLSKIHHYGSYSCRRQRGNGSGQWSEHAFANAWDVSSFELKDGTRIQILKDWEGEKKKSTFLREAKQAACGLFRVTLSPDYNEAHKDHFHLDMGPGRACK